MKKILWSFLEIVETVVVALVAVFLVRTFIAQPFLVSGASMEPNFEDGNYLLVDEITYRFREPDRGEVVVFRYPGNHKSYYIKRIIGLPGERVVINEKGVAIYAPDGEERNLEEGYVTQVLSYQPMDRELGPGEYFVMGDNRNFSFDSRSWGPLKKSEIIGVARVRLWPINRVMAFYPPVY